MSEDSPLRFPDKRTAKGREKGIAAIGQVVRKSNLHPSEKQAVRIAHWCRRSEFRLGHSRTARN